jgi:hypothetical protein
MRMRQKLTLAIAIAFALCAMAFVVSAPAGATQAATTGQTTTPATTTPETGGEPEQPTAPTVPTTPDTTTPEQPAPQPEVIPNDSIGAPKGGGKKGSSTTGGSKGSTKSPKKSAGKDRSKKKGKKTGGKDADELEKEKKKNPLDANDIFGPAPIAVPNMVLDSFEIPPFLLPIYQACGTQYAIPWQLLAAINKIETAFGTNLSVSSAGAMGWMQFMPGTWATYGVDANGDGRKDPYNPVDAICAAARYLRAAGGTERLHQAIFAYNHANWYVEDVLELTRLYSQLPEHLITSLTGLTEGAHFPVAANARYADQITVSEAIRKARTRGGVSGNVANVLSSSPDRRSVTIFARPGAPVVAVNDGVIRSFGHSKELGLHVVLEDAYGNRFTYAGLGSLASTHPVPRRQRLTDADFEMVTPDNDKMPTKPASATKKPADPGAEADQGEEIAAGAPAGSKDARRASRIAERIARRAATEGEHTHRGEEKGHDAEGHDGENGTEEESAAPQPVNTEDSRPRLFARPHRANNADQAALVGQLKHPIAGGKDFETFEATARDLIKFNPKRYEMRPLAKGSHVIGGTVLGRALSTGPGAGTVKFSIRPTGKDSPSIDPKPILDGWRLLAATDIYRAKRNNPFFTGNGTGQVLMLPKSALIRRVLNDPRIEIYACGREDIASGSIDRRILALLSYLAERGFRLTITSLTCGHSYLTTSGNVSNHSLGRAVDIAALNGQPIIGNQGPGSLTEAALKAILRLQGTMAPSELISLHELGGPSFAMADHHDHIHVGYSAIGSGGPKAAPEAVEVLQPGQWSRLMRQLGRIENPEVASGVSAAATPADDGK